MKSKVLILSVWVYFLLSLSSCGKKQHEIILSLDADTIKTTVNVDFYRDTIFVQSEDIVSIDVNSNEVQSIYVELEENTANQTVVLTFDSSLGQEYFMLTGVGFDFVSNQLVVTDEIFLDHETVTQIELLAEVIKMGEAKQFKIIIGIKDVIDIPKLKAHFNFDGKTLQDLVTGGNLVSLTPINYLQLRSFDNYYVSFTGNDNNEVLEWPENTIDLNQDYSICFFAGHQLKSGVATETVLAGYDVLGNQIIRFYFEQGMLKVELEGDVFSELSYSFFTPSKSTLARVAFMKFKDIYSLRVNDNGVKELIAEEPDLLIGKVASWSLGAEKSPTSSNITNEFSGRMDNFRFYQKAINATEYQSIISVDF